MRYVKQPVVRICFLKGHDFSPAANMNRSTRLSLLRGISSGVSTLATGYQSDV